jgi:type II secretory pathway pseudopilin PulG
VAGAVAARRRRGQSGQSLIEVIIAMLLLGGIFVILAGGLLTITRGTETNEKVQAIDTALVTYGEILQTQVRYVSCNDATNGNTSNPTVPAYATTQANLYQQQNNMNYSTNTVDHNGAEEYIAGAGDPAGSTKWRRPANVETDVVSVKYWEPVTKTWIDLVGTSTGCRNPATNALVADSGVQLVKYRVKACRSATTSPCTNPTVRTAEVVKRKSGPS